MPLLTATTCPDSLLEDVHTHGAGRPPAPDDLTYSLTLPASATSPAIARRAVAAILQAHGLPGLTEAAVLVTAKWPPVPTGSHPQRRCPCGCATGTAHCG